MPDRPEPPDRPHGAPPREAVQRWRLVFARGPLDAAVGQREQLAMWEAALAGCGLPVAGLDASAPKPRFAMAAPLSASTPGESELLDLWLTERLPAWRVRERLDGAMPPGHALVDAYDVWLGSPPLPGQVSASVYRATFEAGAVDAAALASACEVLLEADALPRERKKGQGTVPYDLRPFLEALTVEADASADGSSAGAAAHGTSAGASRAAADRIRLFMTLRHDPERGIGRPEEVLLALGERVGIPLEPVALVRASLVLAPALAPVVAPKGPRPRGRQPLVSTSRPRK